MYLQIFLELAALPAAKQASGPLSPPCSSYRRVLSTWSVQDEQPGPAMEEGLLGGPRIWRGGRQSPGLPVGRRCSGPHLPLHSPTSPPPSLLCKGQLCDAGELWSWGSLCGEEGAASLSFSLSAHLHLFCLMGKRWEGARELLIRVAFTGPSAQGSPMPVPREEWRSVCAPARVRGSRASLPPAQSPLGRSHQCSCVSRVLFHVSDLLSFPALPGLAQTLPWARDSLLFPTQPILSLIHE